MKKLRPSTPVRQPLKLQREQIRVLEVRAMGLVAGGADRGVWTTDPSNSGCTSCQLV